MQLTTNRQTRRQATDNHLRRLRADFIERAKNASNEERAAVIRQLDGIISATDSEAKDFWQKVRRQIERSN